MSDYFFETYPQSDIPSHSAADKKAQEAYSFEAVEEAVEQAAVNIESQEEDHGQA